MSFDGGAIAETEASAGIVVEATDTADYHCAARIVCIVHGN
jgi:hypothetical protein